MKRQLYVFGAIFVTTFVAGAQTIGKDINRVQSVVTKSLARSLLPMAPDQSEKREAFRSENVSVGEMANKESPTKLAGGVSTGGGDSDVIEFLNIANALDIFLQKSPQYCPESDCAFFSAYVAKLNKNLGSSERSLISFTPRNLVDVHGTEKEALFNRDNLSIIVNRPQWRSLQNNSKAKYIIVAAEIFGLGGVDQRYFRVGEISKNIETTDSRANAANKFSEAIESLTQAVITCIEAAQHQLYTEVSQIRRKYAGQVAEVDIDMFRQDSLVVARLRIRSCITRDL